MLVKASVADIQDEQVTVAHGVGKVAQRCDVRQQIDARQVAAHGVHRVALAGGRRRDGRLLLAQHVDDTPRRRARREPHVARRDIGGGVHEHGEDDGVGAVVGRLDGGVGDCGGWGVDVRFDFFAAAVVVG